ncbi:MAG TPA: hypothetical protein DDW53_08380 [Lachnoclostridium sp.]|nr:hypothetical protein [Lachnoclostridium sp.]
MRKLKLLIATAALSIIMGKAAFAGEWKQDTKGWRYQNDDGSFQSNSWLQENEKWYYFDSDGYMLTGWVSTVGGKWYYMNPTGDARTEDYVENGVTYHFDQNGACQNPPQTTGQSQEEYNKNIDAINRGETAKAALYNWRESQTIDTTPEVNLGNENIVKVVDYAN